MGKTKFENVEPINYGDSDDEEQILIEKHETKSGELGIIGATFSVMNSVLGGGILSFPYAFAAAGIVGGTIATLILVLFAYGALMIIVLTYEKFGKDKGALSYQAVVKETFGRNMELVMIISIAVYSFGSCIAYLVIIGDQLVAVVDNFVSDTSVWYAGRPFILTTATIIVVVPLSLLKRIGMLKYSSFLAATMVLYFTLMIVVYAFIGTTTSTGQPTYSISVNFPEIMDELTSSSKFKFQFFQCAPIICFAFQCHLSIVPIYAVIKDRNLVKAGGVCGVALGNCTLLYIAAGLFGYITFYCATQSDVLLNYNDSSVAVIICRIGIALVASFAYPIVNFVGRLAIDDFFKWFAILAKKELKPDKIEDAPLRFYSITLVLLVISLLLAIFVPTVNAVVSLLGSIFATLFIFGFPGLFLLKLCNYTPTNKQKIIYQVIGLTFLISGLFLGSLSLLVSLYNDITVVINDVQPSACAAQ